MCFDMTINRIGAFASLTENAKEHFGNLSGYSLVSTFNEHAHKIAKSSLFELAQEDMMKEGLAKGYDLSWIGSTTNSRVEIARTPNQIRQQNKPPKLIARLFPDREVLAIKNDVKWRLKVQFSATSCTFEAQTSYTKLWVSFEILRENGWEKNNPEISEKDIRDIIQLTDAMGEAAFKNLCSAYVGSLKELFPNDLPDGDPIMELLNERIHVAMTDNDHENIAALLDAITTDNRTFQSIKDGHESDAKKGMDEFAKFAAIANKKDAIVEPSRVRLFNDIPQNTAIYYGAKRNDSIDAQSRIVGFSRKRGLSVAWEPYGDIDKKPNHDDNIDYREYITTFSAAKKITSRVAEKVASRREQAIIADFI